MNRLQLLLGKLAEEGSEITQIALKTQQFGLHERHPQLDEDNRQRIHAELNDLLGIVEMLNEEVAFGFQRDETAIARKREKVNHYARYSENLGMVTSS